MRKISLTTEIDLQQASRAYIKLSTIIESEILHKKGGGGGAQTPFQTRVSSLLFFLKKKKKKNIGASFCTSWQFINNLIAYGKLGSYLLIG